MEQIKVTLTQDKKPKPDQTKLGFGKIFTDHMFIMPYSDGKWHSPEIKPYGNLPLPPAAMVFHYGQEVFEGLKAYRAKDGRTLLFRPDENFKRLNESNLRLCIPQIDEEFALHALKELIKVDEDWVPTEPDTSLYIRPFIIATDPQVGVHPSHTYLFIIILSPVGAYFAEGLKPVKIYVEQNYVRAVKGGMGFAKTGGNYATSLKAQAEADEQGYSQVLWLDGTERQYIEEVGAMNIFFKIGGEVITPELQGSILSGITRKSVLALLREWGVPTSERRLSIDEVCKAADAGKLEEVFGAGTAAVISPVGHLKYGDKVMDINGGRIGATSQKLYDTLTGIQYGNIEGPKGWVVDIRD